MADRSAVIVPVALPPELLAVRSRDDWMASRGIPPHVTVLFPFLPADALTPDVEAELAAVAAAQRPFVARFERAEALEELVWLLPADQSPFLGLTAAVTARWPAYLPYDGAHDELIAHLTLVENADAACLASARAAAEELGPFEALAAELQVIIEDAPDHWELRWRLPFGTAEHTGGDA